MVPFGYFLPGIACAAYNPAPAPAAVVWCDANARFTVLTPLLVRAEWVPYRVRWNILSTQFPIVRGPFLRFALQLCT